MTFLAPAFMVAAGLVAGAVVLVHFIVTREPRPVPLPTARFVPLRPVRARARRIRLQDIILMLLRVLTILAVGAGLAQPILDPTPAELTRIIVVDRSRAIEDPAEVADSVRSIYREGDALILFDAATATIEQAGLDSIGEITRSEERGKLSPALITAFRTASTLRERADSFELALISPLAAEVFDGATDSIRALWPGSIRHLPVGLRTDMTTLSGAAFAGAADDPLRYSLRDLREPADTGEVGVLIMRGELSAADSAWVAAGPRTLVHWPATDASDDADHILPVGWSRRALPDTVGGVSAGDLAVVAPFERWAEFGPEETAGSSIVARWADGSPAAVEKRYGDGCVRTVAIGAPSVGDLVLQPRFIRMAAALTAPCASMSAPVPADSTRLAALIGADSVGTNVAGLALPIPEVIRSPYVPWLFAAALVLALAALILQYWIGRKTESLDPVEAA